MRSGFALQYKETKSKSDLEMDAMSQHDQSMTFIV